MPTVAVAWLALFPTENIWPHLMATVLPRYLGNTLLLMTGVGVLTAMVGTGAAWLLTLYRFPGSRTLGWMMLLPMAVPAYIGAYALVDFLDYGGPVQRLLRETFGFSSARDYWFPQIRSIWGAVLVLSGALIPYVYLLARAAFREQSAGAYQVARALGAGPWRLFFRVGLPLARPAVAAGVALAMMETVNDFGVVDYFAVQTLTTGVFSTWISGGNAGGAAQIAGVSLVLIFALVAIERQSRRRLRVQQSVRQSRPVTPTRLTGWRGWTACALCLLPIMGGFALPVAVMTLQASDAPGGWTDPELGSALIHTLITAGTAAVLTVSAALFLVYAVRLAGRRVARGLLPLTTVGYAAPGAVLAVGILVPMAAVDHGLADLLTSLTGRDPGLLFTGTPAAIIYAYCVRFFALALGAADAAVARVPESLPMAARSLGRTAGGTLRAVFLPQIRGSVAAALLLVFVDGAKELPATLLLRPFNYATLATRVQERASLENLPEAAPAALLVTGIGIVAVLLLAHTGRSRA